MVQRNDDDFVTLVYGVRLRFGIWYNLSLVNGHMATLTIEYHLRLMGYILVDAMAMVRLDVSFRC